MNKRLLGFDPLLFLGITNLKDGEKNVTSQKLLDKISEVIKKSAKDEIWSFKEQYLIL